MNNLYLNIFYIFIVLAVGLLVLSIVLFIRFNIPKVIGDITGRNSKKEIKKTRELNEKSGKKEYKASKVNQERGTITDDISGSGKKRKIEYGVQATEDLEIPAQQATTILSSDSTTVLSDNSTTVLSSETTVLSDSKETSKNNPDSVELPNINPSDFVVEEDISFTESNEVIV